MQLVDSDRGKVIPVIWDAYKAIVKAADDKVLFFCNWHC